MGLMIVLAEITHEETQTTKTLFYHYHHHHHCAIMFCEQIKNGNLLRSEFYPRFWYLLLGHYFPQEKEWGHGKIGWLDVGRTPS